MNYFHKDNPADVRDLTDTMAMWIATDNPKQYDWIEQPPQPSPEAQWQGGQWVIPPAPVYTAGEWLELVGFGSSQQPTLIYLKLQLQMYGRRSDKLNETEQFLNSVLASFAHDPTPRSDWEQPPYEFQEVVAECMEVLA